MRHTWMLGVLMLAGCSTHPVVDAMDFFRPGKMYPNDVPPYGGVCVNQGAILLPAQPIVVAPGPSVVPPPVPLPPGTPSGQAPPPAFPTITPVP
jgi:hypothetical protein